MVWERGEGTCTHTLEVRTDSLEQYESSDEKRWLLSEQVPGVEDGEWHCPHDRLAGRDRCPFHLPVEERPPGFDGTEAFLDVVAETATVEDRDDRRRQLQFIDATFEELDLRSEVVDGVDNQYLNLAYAEIGSADWTDARIAQPVRFAHATFLGEVDFRDVVFGENAGFRGTTFRGPVNFRGAEFGKPTNFKLATFEEPVTFWYALFRNHALFRLATFRAEADFEAVDFTDYARFTAVTFEGPVDFTLAEFGDDADFVRAELGGDHTFTGATVDRTLDVSDATVDGPVRLDSTTVERLVLTPRARREGATYVDLSESHVGGGRLGQPAAGDILYDVTDATLESVEFTHPEGEAVADHVRFVGTAYEGFEFENDDLDPQADDWAIHEVFDPSLLADDREATPSTAALRRTYLNAKNGADRTGNNAAAGAFYYREMTYRRRHHAELAGDRSRPLADRLRDANRWVRNWTLMALTGYGERPDRVVYASAAMVLGFAGLYATLLAGTPGESLLLSVQSYVTFILGPSPDQASLLVETLSAVEGFLGAFLVALFVFTFTRRLNR